ncbi:MAG: hypothetical protein AB7L94_05720 [Kofleriaceae bacterium]
MSAPFVIHANLDAEARWAGGSLPGAIATRVSYYAALLSVLAPPDAEVEVWAPAAIDPARLIDPASSIDAARSSEPSRSSEGATGRPAMRVGTPPRADLAWARADAKAANDRRLALSIARELGSALPGAAVIETVDDLVAWTRDAPRTTAGARWVTKAPWTTAGRDRCHGEGAPTVEQRTRISRLVERFGALVVEPWVDRVLDVGLCARIDEFRPRLREGDGRDERAHGHEDFYVTLSDPHSLITDARGTFLGIDLAPPALLPHEATQLGVTAREVGARLAAIGFRGPFAIDAFVYRDTSGARRFHPLCEINARHTFGHVARAFAARGATRLGFGEPPAGATVLVAPANDGITAWIA